MSCQEKDCSFKCARVAHLRQHLAECHGFPFTEIVLQFDNSKQFLSYLRKFERENTVEFYNCSHSNNLKSKVTYYRCNRSGFYRESKEAVQRRTKNQGSCKIEGHCTAYVKSKEEFASGKVTMELCNSHYGHDTQLVHLRVPKEDKLHMADRLNEGVNFKDVLYQVKAIKTSGKRSSLIKSKDVYNVLTKEQRKRQINIGVEESNLPKRSEIVQRCPVDEIKPCPTFNDTPSTDLDNIQSDVSKQLKTKITDNLRSILDEVSHISEIDTLQNVLSYSETFKSVVLSYSSKNKETASDEGIVPMSSNTMNIEVFDNNNTAAAASVMLVEDEPSLNHVPSESASDQDTDDQLRMLLKNAIETDYNSSGDNFLPISISCEANPLPVASQSNTSALPANSLHVAHDSTLHLQNYLISAVETPSGPQVPTTAATQIDVADLTNTNILLVPQIPENIQEPRGLNGILTDDDRTCYVCIDDAVPENIFLV